MRARVLHSVVLAVLGGCNVSNTGNPNSQPGSHPEGIELLRSELTRDETPDVSESDLTRFAGDQRALTFALYGQLADGSENLFFSPYSVATALAMTYAGAAGETKEEMATALRFALPEPALHAAFNAVDRALAQRAGELAEQARGDGFQLTTTNAVFAARNQEVHDAFLDALAQNYGTGLFLADFEGAPERERVAINRWVADRTEQRIDALLPAASITADTRLVLINTIYFKGSWLVKFDRAMTAAAPFHAASGDRTVQMMHGTSRQRYARGSDYQALELPYVSPSVRMLLVLPDEGQLAAVEGRLASGLFDEARGALAERLVDMRLPRFSFRVELELKSVLKALGMSRAFAGADFSRIGGPPGHLFIKEVYHDAFVALDEQGTEAAAATAVVIERRSAAEPASITLDRPFLFFVYDQPTAQILFAGRLSEPE